MNVDARTEELFNELAEAQRGAPEAAGQRIQGAQISQLYGETAEHVGDLTHRMSQSVNFFHGGYEWVREKVEKTFRWLTSAYGFEREVREQIQRNFDYYGERDRIPERFGSSPKEALANLKLLGQEYADEHVKLVVYNDVQQIARGAAIAVGEWRFGDAVRLLRLLKKVLDKGEKAWEREAMKTSFGSESGGEGLHGARPSKYDAVAHQITEDALNRAEWIDRSYTNDLAKYYGVPNKVILEVLLPLSEEGVEMRDGTTLAANPMRSVKRGGKIIWEHADVDAGKAWTHYHFFYM